MDFGKALELLRKGSILKRKDWDKTKLGIKFICNATYPQFDKRNGSKLTGDLAEFIVIDTTYRCSMPYTPTSEDLLAWDWEEVK